LGFADASQKGYAAVVYLRVVDLQDEVTVHFLTSKTKVTPLKASQADESLTIPRLELCAALLLKRLLVSSTPNLKEANWKNGKYGDNADGTCTCCGNMNHVFSNCYFKNRNCEICNKKGHLKKVCYFNKNKTDKVKSINACI